MVDFNELVSVLATTTCLSDWFKCLMNWDGRLRPELVGDRLFEELCYRRDRPVALLALGHLLSHARGQAKTNMEKITEREGIELDNINN